MIARASLALTSGRGIASGDTFEVEPDEAVALEDAGKAESLPDETEAEAPPAESDAKPAGKSKKSS